MSSQGVEQLRFDFVADLPVIVQQSQALFSGEAGLLPIMEFDRRWKFTSRFVDCLVDPAPDRKHSLLSMARQRIFGSLAGYEDCNDHDTLRDDPVFKMIANRLPDGQALASQPTLSRFENLATPAVLQKLIDFNIQTGIERLQQKHGGQLPASLTLDLDATDDPTHGQQQLTLFHGYYEQYQYFPLILSEPTTKHVFLGWLRPGTMHASMGADEDLMRVVDALRKERPDIQIHVRGDAGFGLPIMYETCEKHALTYTLGFSTNTRLKKLTEGLMSRAVEQYEQTKQKQRLFMCVSYQCDSWDKPRTVIAKAECHAGGTNLRFVVTNLPDVTAAEHAGKVYDDYIERGESEHRMDELKNGLKMDRLSCHRFKANFFRLLLYIAAMNLLNAFRDDPTLPEVLRRGQPCTWRSLVIKAAVRIVQSTRRLVIHLSSAWPNWPFFKAAFHRATTFHCTS
jgi:hypothetical protein